MIAKISPSHKIQVKTIEKLWSLIAPIINFRLFSISDPEEGYEIRVLIYIARQFAQTVGPIFLKKETRIFLTDLRRLKF